MGYTQCNFTGVEPVADGMHFLREELETEQLGFTVIDVEDSWDGRAHDHAESGEEEIYFLVEGHAEIELEDESVALDPGDAIRVAPDTTRDLSLGPDTQMIVVGAP